MFESVGIWLQGFIDNRGICTKYWFWPRILAHFVHESEHSGGFTNGEFWHQARADRHPFFYISRLVCKPILLAK